MTSSTDGGISRRGFLLGAGTGLVLGGGLAWYGLHQLHHRRDRQPSPFTGHTVENPRSEFAMPGPFPGRVIEVRHRDAVREDHSINDAAVRDMMHRGMCELTGAEHPSEAWRRFFCRGDVVGIKVNPVGFKPPNEPSLAHKVGSISSPAVLLEVVAGLRSAGVRPRDIIVFERYAAAFRDAGYEELMREPALDGVRWFASGTAYHDQQVAIDGYDTRRDRDPHVTGYDPDVFVHMGFASPDHDPRDDRRFRTHLSVIVSRMVNKIVTIPCLKDHRSAGVTLALKNMSHGFNNNVARSHISGIYRRDQRVSGPNQCNTFIPTAVAQPLIRQKATLHIMDGLIGVYEGGPGCWNRTWATWQHKGLFFATDPVAMDLVGWQILDARRAAEGWLPVAQMGQLNRLPVVTLSPRLAALAAQGTPEAAALALAEHRRVPDGSHSEVFDRRQPEHILLAGILGLGRWQVSDIEHRVVQLV
jgi:uncharacterized protein (DUF362 family)